MNGGSGLKAFEQVRAWATVSLTAPGGRVRTTARINGTAITIIGAPKVIYAARHPQFRIT